MDKPQIHRAGLAVSLGDIRLHGAVQIRVARIIRLRGHIRRLDDHEQVIILIDDGYAVIAFHLTYALCQRPLAPHGSTPPAVTGRQTSSAVMRPPKRGLTVMSIILPSTLA